MRQTQITKLKISRVILLRRTEDDLNTFEFMSEVRFIWGERPFWWGISLVGNTMEEAYWGLLEDFFEPDLPHTLCYLGRTRSEVFSRIKTYLSFS